MTLPHYMLIQSAYTDAGLSARRLEITKHSCLPSLRYQALKPIVHVVVNPVDPLLSERRAVFESSGCEVEFIDRDTWRLYGEDWELPAVHKVVSRMDDDDVIAAEFCQSTNDAAPDTEAALVWPSGYVFWRSAAFSLRHPGNQFVSLATADHDPHEVGHWKFCQQWPTRVVSDKPGWIWIRHGDAVTSTIGKYRQRRVNRIDSQRIPINLRAIDRAIVGSGLASGDYAEHARRPGHSIPPSQALTIHGSDKTSVHNYAAFYDQLWTDLKPLKIVEIGVLKGASLRAWKYATPSATVIGADRNPVPGLDVVQIVTPDYGPLVERLREVGPVDLIIDDGSHKLSDQMAGAEALWDCLRAGGAYVVEDVQSESDGQAFGDRGWTLHDWSTRTGRWDDRIAIKWRKH
jgi:hypothetical protein